VRKLGRLLRPVRYGQRVLVAPGITARFVDAGHILGSASIELTVEERALTISGGRARPRVPGQVYQQAEIEYGRFERRIPLEQDIDTAAASAAYEAGMLRITLPVARRAPTVPAVVIVVRRTT